MFEEMAHNWDCQKILMVGVMIDEILTIDESEYQFTLPMMRVLPLKNKQGA